MTRIASFQMTAHKELLTLSTLVKKYVTETNLKDEHAFQSMVIQKSILNKFVKFLGEDITKEMISLKNLEKFKENVLEPEMEYQKKKAKEVGVPFDVYLGLLPIPVMSQRLISWYMNDIKMFITWCHSES